MKLYQIEKLACRYYDKKLDKNVNVLDAENLQIHRGEITVILGPSGGGKSTFMEAISLMSSTINPDHSSGVYFYDKNDVKIDLVETIQKGVFDIQEHRFEKFCFIFQDTNIMENFDAKENVSLPKMSKKPTGALNSAEAILRESLNLKIDLGKAAGSYSGGQKQRFAFARAFLADGEILFGDEPTGNLDNYNSEKLFGVIRQCVRRPKEMNGHSITKNGAIIVTHNIDLALHFADQIIVIVKPERLDDECVIQTNKELVKGYTNHFFCYHNENGRSWRDESSMDGFSVNEGLLPPIDDNGTNRFSFTRDENGDFIKDKMKREIIFFLNNSYAAPQQLLIKIAQKLNADLKKLEEAKDPQLSERKKKMFGYFNLIKTAIIDIVIESVNSKLTIKEFEISYFGKLKERLKQLKEIPDENRYELNKDDLNEILNLVCEISDQSPKIVIN